ncbi:MAG TPA: dTDP-glucose 4,6-dehydratase [Dictyoglomaceae bacterium]|nr:dTDP-glucose 4,6-dehydratase [Dictyoglomaceae bacterium]
MKILVTGGCGFMGSDFVRKAMKLGLDVVVVDKLTYAGDKNRLREIEGKYKLYISDITDLDALEEVFKNEKPEYVVHYAAETHVDRSIIQPDVFVKTNVLGTFNLLKLSLDANVKKFIHISTDEVYGELPKDKSIKFTEESPLRAKSPYSASKAGADHFVQAFIKTYKLPAVIIRASNNYGPWQYPEKLIPLTIAKAISNEKIPVYGNGRNVRTWLYVEDFTEAVLSILEKGIIGEIYNVGSNEEKENIDVIRKILTLLEKGEDLMEFIPDRPGHDLRYALDTSKVEKEIGWRAKTSFEEGIEKTVRWYLDNVDWLLEKKVQTENFVKKLKEEFKKYAHTDNRG